MRIMGQFSGNYGQLQENLRIEFWVSGKALCACPYLSPEKWSGKFWSGGPFFHGILVRGDYFSMEKWSGRTKFPWRNGPVMEKWSALHETFLPVAGRPKRVISSQLYNYNRLNRQMLAAGRAFLLTERSLDMPGPSLTCC